MEKKTKKFFSVSEQLKLVDEIKLGKPVKDAARDCEQSSGVQSFQI